MQLTLRYHETAQRPVCAAFLRGSDPAAWLREMGRWDLDAAQLQCYLVPESIRSVQVAGLFVVASAPLPADLLEPYGVVAGRLFVPVQAGLWPSTTPEELGRLLLWPRQLLHPSLGFIGFEAADELDLSTLLRTGPPRATDWGLARPGLPPKPRLLRVEILRPSAEEVVESIREDVGTEPLTQLLGSKESQPGPGSRLWLNLRHALLVAALGVVQAVRGFFGSELLKVLGAAVGILMLVLLFLGLFVSVGNGSFSGMGIVVAVVLMLLARGIGSFMSGRVSSGGTSRQPVRRPTGSSGGPGGLSRLERWLGGSIKDLEQKRQNEIERLLRLFGENMEEALKYAIPLGGSYQDRGTAAPSAHLGPRATDFSLGGWVEAGPWIPGISTPTASICSSATSRPPARKPRRGATKRPPTFRLTCWATIWRLPRCWSRAAFTAKPPPSTKTTSKTCPSPPSAWKTAACCWKPWSCMRSCSSTKKPVTYTGSWSSPNWPPATTSAAWTSCSAIRTTSTRPGF
ncbi:hypothetical protein [Hymenobacter cellulosilyticus]|uniref:MoxR-vWA-beta-propeller ternary system domain-containing protein n=1 Tax=Hymenobacter cellulosilyticus TaxID=2932248 RepID=A0A8T9Q3S9_9BACT|nr:hypothetical protein [Hymenobacter cellulosilyticus]UOQ70450.1 hypothetical protein MUN79_17125 [Hymenobacter cellulosilyticus]